MSLGSALPRILIVDHHDSYTLNLLALLLPDAAFSAAEPEQRRNALSQALAERVVVLPHTHPLLEPAKFRTQLRPHIDAIILSPGPGTPENPDDFGSAEKLLTDPELGLPVLGVCLGHQGLATAFGGKVVPALSVRHGLKSALLLTKSQHDAVSARPDLMEGIPDGTEVVRYNSLTVDEDSLPACLRVTAWAYDEPCPAPPPHTRLRHDLLRSCVQHSLSRARQSGTTTPRLSDQAPSGRSTPSDSILRFGRRALHEGSSDASSSIGELDDDLLEAEPDQRQRVVLALEHRTRPLYGVQFHPESIESSLGRQLMNNFLAIVRAYWLNLAASEARKDASSRLGDCKLPLELIIAGARCVARSAISNPDPAAPPRSTQTKAFRIITAKLDAPTFEYQRAAPELFRRLFQQKSKVGAVWLDSARLKDPHSRFSYMAIPAFALSYHASTRQLHLNTTGDICKAVAIQMPNPTGQSAVPPTFWDFMDGLQRALKAATDDPLEDHGSTAPRLDGAGRVRGSLFRTGLVGYFGYEMKGESLGLDSPVPTSDKERPDCEFIFCNRVLAFDHHLEEWKAFALSTAVDSDVVTDSALGSPLSLVQEALQRAGSHTTLAVTEDEAQEWFRELHAELEQMPAAAESCHAPHPHSIKDALPPLVPRLASDDYMYQIESAREQIAAGESYELCLTTQFQGSMPEPSDKAEPEELDHFGLYCKLRARNPAPYSAFIRLPSDADAQPHRSQRGRSIVCTSPERFMRITREGEVEMKPIKGTLARAGYGQDEEGMRAGTGTPQEEEEKRRWREAGDARRRSRLAADVKERAENLMIVDLIRADLFSFCQPHSVVVPSLMSVETYETVHQLVTTVRGQLKDGVGTSEAVRRCFPPGSMTGAPKLRSVQLLERLEADRMPETRARRGIYSGALGWLGIDGAADFAVVIRTLVADGNEVSIGAGGAITYLSDAAKEWSEVLDKVGALASIRTV